MNMLTSIEKEVARLLVLGFTNKEISAKIYRSISTVKTNIANMLNKFRAKNRVHLAYILGCEKII